MLKTISNLEKKLKFYVCIDEKKTWSLKNNKMILDFLRHLREIKDHLDDDQDPKQNQAI